MPRPPKSAHKARAKPQTPAKARWSSVRLNAGMRCDTAFRIIARRHVEELDANRPSTCAGDPEGLHRMRIALTQLRAVIRFFSPMVNDSIAALIRGELKWLNDQLGPLRDLDIAVERIRAAHSTHPKSIPGFQAWREQQAEGHRQLTRSLKSARYLRLIQRLTGWIEAGPWSRRLGKRASERRAFELGRFSADKLARWERKLVKKSRGLRDMGPRKRHRLRIASKRLNYSIGSLSELFADRRFSKHKAAMKPLRKVQKSLGQLNDDIRSRALASAFRRKSIAVPVQPLKAADKKRLLRRAETAYRRLAALKPWK